MFRALSACTVAASLMCGCEATDSRKGKVTDPDDSSFPEDPPPADPESCVCTPVAPFGYDGPSIVGRAAELTQIHCPEDASLPGFSGLVVSTNEWARECRITPLPTCGASGWVCAPPPPRGFSLCIYRAEPFGCPHDYHLDEPVLESDPAGVSDAKPVTLCCADQPDTG